MSGPSNDGDTLGLDVVDFPVAGSTAPVGRRFLLLRGSSWALTNSLVRMAVSFATVPLTIGYLGKERYGLWMVVLSATSILTLLDAGITPTILNGLSAARAQADDEAFEALAATGFWIGAAFLGVSLLITIAAPLFDWATIFNVHEPDARREVLPLLQVIIVSGAIPFSLATSEQVFSARLQLVKPRMYALAASLLGLGLLVVAIKLQASLPVLAAVTTGPQGFYRLAMAAELFGTDRRLFRLPRRSNFERLWSMTTSSVLFFGIQLSGVLLSSSPNILVAERLSLADAGVFSVAARLFSIPVGLQASVLPVFWPAFTQAWQKRDLRWLRRVLLRVCLLSVGVMLCFGIGAVAFGGWFLQVWTRGRVVVPRSLLVPLALWLACQSAIYWLSTFLHSIADLRFELLVYFFSALILLVAGPPLLGRLGLTGIAAAMALALAVGSLVPMTVRVRQRLIDG